MKLAAVALLLVLTCNPADGKSEGDTRRVRFEIDVRGTLKFNPAGRGMATQPIKAYGEISFDQRLQQTSRHGVYAARHYRHAEAVATVGKTKTRRTLRPTRSTIAVAQGDATKLRFDPLTGPLTSDELDLVETQFDPLYLAELAPAGSCKVGDKSVPTKALLASLLLVDIVHQSDIQTEVIEANDSTATIRIRGGLSAAADGVSSEITVAGGLQFARDSQQFTRVDITIAEKRAIGHAAPGFDLTASIKTTLSPVSDSPHLSAPTLARLEKQLENEALLVSYTSHPQGWQLLHDRRWKVLVDQPEALIMRMIDHGDLIAQCNASRLARLPDGEQVSLETFQVDVKNALAERFGDFMDASTTATQGGARVFRVHVQGTVSELPVHWVYYLVDDGNGQRASLVFTFASDLANQFADADRVLVSRLRFLSPQPATEARNADSSRR